MHSVQLGSILWLLSSQIIIFFFIWSTEVRACTLWIYCSTAAICNIYLHCFLHWTNCQLLDDFILNLIISFHSINEFRFRFHHDTNLLLKEIHNFTPFTAMVFEITKYNVQLETWSLMIPFVTRTVNTLFGHRRLILERVMKQISRLNDRQRYQNKAILISLNTLYVWCLSAFWYLVYCY